VERMNVSEELDFAADLEIDQAIGASRAARKAVGRALQDEALREADAAEAPAAARQKQKE